MQAKEFGEAEVWMNERLMRAAPRFFAKFITAFEEDKDETSKPGKPGLGPGQKLKASNADENPLWLVSSHENQHLHDLNLHLHLHHAASIRSCQFGPICYRQGNTSICSKFMCIQQPDP